MHNTSITCHYLLSYWTSKTTYHLTPKTLNSWLNLKMPLTLHDQMFCCCKLEIRLSGTQNTLTILQKKHSILSVQTQLIENPHPARTSDLQNICSNWLQNFCTGRIPFSVTQTTVSKHKWTLKAVILSKKNHPLNSSFLHPPPQGRYIAPITMPALWCHLC